MTSGYISADTYRRLLPKQYFSELSIADSQKFYGNCRREINTLFKDEQTHLAISFLEKIETDISQNSNTPYVILDQCLLNNKECLEVIKRIGRRTFLLDYVYCTYDSLKTHNYVNEGNISKILKLIRSFRTIYQGLGHITDLSTKELEMLKALPPSEQNTNDGSIKSGDGFLNKDIIFIDDDAFSPSCIEYKKYVLFLYSLSKEELESITDYLQNLLKKVSIRTFNSIKGIGLRNFLVNYLFADDKKLLKIRNLGKKSLFDLSKVKPMILKYISCIYESSDTSKVDNSIEQENKLMHKDFTTLKERIGDGQYSILIKELEMLIEEISVRSQNGIHNYKGDFIEDFVNKRGDLRSLPNIGKKSEKEINVIVEKLRALAGNMEEREVTEEEVFKIEKSSYYGYCFDDYAFNFYRENKHLPMFYMFEILFKNEIAKNRNFKIFDLHTPVFKEEDYFSLEEIANYLSLTRERVRQLYSKLNSQLHRGTEGKAETKDISIWKFLSNHQDWQYIREAVSSYNLIEVPMIRDISSKEEHNFTDVFLVFIVSLITKDILSIVGKDPIPYRTRDKQKWNNCYLIKKKFTDKFDFDGIFQIIEGYEESHKEDFIATVNEMLLDFFYAAWKEFDSGIVDDLSKIVTTILIQEFGLIPDDNFCFTIEGRKEENVTDILYELLLTNGNPMSLDELYLNIDAKYPGKYKSPASIRIIVMRDPRLCSVGVNNLIGLLEWDHIKIGSIRDIIVQYLNSFEEPQHISQIAKHVQRYRDTTENSIRSTMISGNQFVQFGGGLFGLKDKQYSKVFYLDENDRYFEQRIHELEIFLQENKHFPYMQSNPVEESLYRWWNKNKRSTTLKDRQKSEVARILSVYKTLPTSKRNSEWFDFCQAYFNFVKINKRRPSRHSMNEKDLFAWFDKAIKDFSEGRLNSQQEKAFLELCKSL